jgi:hypothetical protein
VGLALCAVRDCSCSLHANWLALKENKTGEMLLITQSSRNVICAFVEHNKPHGLTFYGTCFYMCLRCAIARGR